MSISASKSIFIAYGESDISVAKHLREALTGFLGDGVWMRDFDLDGGSVFVEALTDAAAEAKWFIILVSEASIQNRWLRLEANLSTMRSIEDLDVKIIVVKLEKLNLPQHLKFALESQMTVDLFRVEDQLEEFFRIAEYIANNSFIQPKKYIYVDRGDKTDEFTLVARRNSIIFILGMPGIGKTAFSINSVANTLKKKPCIVRITRGHSLDLLSRQILKQTHTQQPIFDNVSDEQLLLSATDAIKDRSDRIFLLLDNAEAGLNGANQLLPYLQQFLETIATAESDTHVILTTTRIAEIPVSISHTTDVIQLSGLGKRYIKESIDLLLIGNEKHDDVMDSELLDDIVDFADGHPLAAKMLASFLKVHTPQELLESTERHRFELRLAQFILQSADHTILTDLHKLILHILATVREPMLLEDMLSVTELKAYPLETVQQARLDLSNWFLLQQDGEWIYLHNFLAAYYADQIVEVQARRDNIAREVGHYAFDKAMTLNNQLQNLLYIDLEERSSKETLRLSNEIFRYAVPAEKLLRSINEIQLAQELPIQIKGTLREMVFFFYQEKKDYKQALEYAENWLRLNPDDIEIVLQKIRCYRNFRNAESSRMADELLDDLQKRDFGKYFSARVFREKALVAEGKRRPNDAKEYFREGIKLDSIYPENYVGLAALLLKEAETLSIHDPQRQKLAREAVGLLKNARKNQSALFERFHLSLYVEALIEAGDESTAFPILRVALKDRPSDPRLNHRMAEILREREQYNDAEEYALKANSYGHSKAPLSLANILYGQAQQLFAQKQDERAHEKLAQALKRIEQFRPEFGGDEEVADSIKAKIYRTLEMLPEAYEALKKYKNTKNTYTIHEQSKIDLAIAKKKAAEGRYGQALNQVDIALQRMAKYGPKLNQALIDISEEAKKMKLALEAAATDL